MEPRYMNFGEVDSSALPLQHENKCGIRAKPDLFRLVNFLGLGSSLVGGRVQFGSLLLKTDHINT